ncbi:MAG: hypothetical protein NZ523_00820 [Elioraea sp.]|nr:hypothetical protein [Elioraea sp.]
MDYANLMRQLICFYGDEEELNYFIHILPSRRVIYFTNPKSACSTVLGTLHLASVFECEQKVADKFGLTLEEINSRQMIKTLAPWQIGYEAFVELLSDPRVLKF